MLSCTHVSQPIEWHPCCGRPYEQHNKRDWDYRPRSHEGNPRDRVFHIVSSAVIKLTPVILTTQQNKKCFAHTSSCHDVSTNTDVVEHLYPTDERVRWKEQQKIRKSQGIEVKRKVKVIEDHFDDCGTDLSGLEPTNISEDVLFELELPEAIESDEEEDNWTTGLTTFWMLGSDKVSGLSKTRPRQLTLANIASFFEHIKILPAGVDVVELCGGEGRVSTIAVRRRCSTGENFDLITNWDLNDANQQRMVLMYLRVHRPLVVVMSPTCRPFRRLGNYN